MERNVISLCFRKRRQNTIMVVWSTKLILLLPLFHSNRINVIFIILYIIQTKRTSEYYVHIGCVHLRPGLVLKKKKYTVHGWATVVDGMLGSWEYSEKFNLHPYPTIIHCQRKFDLTEILSEVRLNYEKPRFLRFPSKCSH